MNGPSMAKGAMIIEKTKTYDYETSVYNRIKNKGVKEIEPFDFLTKNS